MKRGNRKLKAMDDMAQRVFRKPRLTDEPKNRSERRALARLARKAQKEAK